MADETIATYDATAGAFAERWFDMRLAADMARLTACLPPGAPVLDVGCGPGHDTAWLAELGFDAVGIDLSAGMLREGRARGVTAPLIRADMAHLPFRDGSFRGLWVCASLIHIPRDQAPAVLLELARVVRPGHACILVKHGDGAGWTADERGRRRFFTYYRRAELARLVQSAGFEVLEEWDALDQAGRAVRWIGLLARSCYPSSRSTTRCRHSGDRQ